MATGDDNDTVSSSPEGFRLRWDVFLSFRGEDTRATITKSLYEGLEKRGVRVFRDDDALNRGDEIAPSLLEAIEDSTAAIVILSPRYAESKWCLEELAKICERRSRLILPVFYQVDPSHVRHQNEPFAKHFRVYEQLPEIADKVPRWRSAMEKVGGIAGYIINTRDPNKHVMRREPPMMKGVELKKWGIHLVYEGDDDYEGSEESLNESQLSLSEKMARFFSSFEEGD